MAGRNVVYETVAKDEKHEELQKPPERPQGLGIRHLQTVILFICLTIAYTIRSQLSVLMVAMVRVQDPLCTLPDGTRNISEGCADPNANISRWNIYRTYDWHKSTQEMITFSFFVGYTSMMIPMGLFAQKFGGKLPIMIALAVNGVISICTPWIALLGGWIAMSISRLALGMTQAAMYPSIHTLLAKWAPLRERGRLSTYIYTGSQAGTIIAFQLSGLFAGSPIFGWPVSFWLFGSLSLMSCALLGWLVVATPHQHPTITSEELAYIMEDGAVDIVPKKRKTPWKHILTSKPVWGLIVSHAGSAASYLLILTEIPIYMNHILHVDLKRNGLYSSLPYIALYLVALLFGYAADFAANRKIMSVVNIRRTANTIAMAGSGVFLFAFSFVNDTTWAVLVLIIAHGLHAGIHVGFHINQIDLAPNFAGPVMAVGNMIANLTSLLVPVIVSNIVKDDVTNHRKWQYVFMIFVAIMIISNAIFVWFAKGTVQPWNFYGEDENAPVLYFLLMSSFFWLNSFSVCIWRGLRVMGVYKATRREKLMSFCRYSLYAWGVPLVITGIVTYLDNIDLSKIDYIVKPPFDDCFKNETGVKNYYFIPLGVIMSINIVLFVITIYHILTTRYSTKRNAEFKRSGRENSYKTYMKLSLTMGISWVLELIPNSDNTFLFILSNTYNSLIGVIIFFVYIFDKNVLNELCEKFNIQNEFVLKIARRKSLFRLARSMKVSREESSSMKTTATALSSEAEEKTSLNQVSLLPDPADPTVQLRTV